MPTVKNKKPYGDEADLVHNPDLLTASPAFAEVCDKKRPRWNPKNGSVNQFEEQYFFFASPLGIGLIIIIMATPYF
ncbi:DUF3153 domain-containing protein [Sulfitobacter sp.]|uniref:DUF3153 domain-containing protein n=1 Tax=Sulfitobacter sp. TaxID=1903071 RepID=UPI003EF11F43